MGLYGLHIGQMLLTRADLEDRERYLNARDTLRTLLDHRIIPVINENDAVATAEIKVGDNDNLSARAAILADADLLILLTDQKGLFTADPRTNPDAQLIEEVQTIDDTLRKLAGDSVSGLGTGEWSAVSPRASASAPCSRRWRRRWKGARAGSWQGLLPTAKCRWIRAPWPPCRRRAPACCPRA